MFAVSEAGERFERGEAFDCLDESCKQVVLVNKRQSRISDIGSIPADTAGVGLYT